MSDAGRALFRREGKAFAGSAIPCIEPGKRARLVQMLMDARRAVKYAKSAGDRNAELEAFRRVDESEARPWRARPGLVDARLQPPRCEEHAICHVGLIGLIRGTLSRLHSGPRRGAIFGNRAPRRRRSVSDDPRRAPWRRWVFENAAKAGRAAARSQHSEISEIRQTFVTSQPSQSKDKDRCMIHIHSMIGVNCR